MTGVDPTRPSPRWLARRVQLAGMRSISLAVDITNYVMLETGQPIHAYDADRLDGPIVVRQAAAGEKLTTLDDVVRDARPRRPADHRRLRPDRPGRRDGRRDAPRSSGDHPDVVIEAAHFDAMTIARTSRRHKLSSEASRRFERGVDPAAGVRGRAPGRRSCWSSWPAARSSPAETVVGAVPAAAPTTHRRRPAGPGPRAPTVDRDTVVSLLEAVGADGRSSTATTLTHHRRRAGDPTCATRTTTSKRSAGWSATTRSRRSCRGPRSAAG